MVSSGMMRLAILAAILALALPAAADEFPKLKRDPSGRIVAVPDGPITDNMAPGSSGGIASIPSRPPASPLGRYNDAGPTARRQSPDPFSAISVHLDQTRRMQEAKARQIQADVDRIVRQESGRRWTGQTPQLRALIADLQRRDHDVQLHENQHYQTGRPFTHAPEYWYVNGPDGRRYAVSGVTRIDMSVIPGDPGATLQKFLTLRRAALAPADPSDEDRRLALELDRAILQYQTERNVPITQALPRH